MTKIKTLIAITVLSTAVATPVFAQGVAHHTYKHRNILNRINDEPVYAAPANSNYLAMIEKDRSRPGGEDPDFNPAGN